MTENKNKRREAVRDKIRSLTALHNEVVLGCDVDKLTSWHLSEIERVTKKLSDYVMHEADCISGQYKAGRPTTDGGYEHLYGYGKDEKWYKHPDKPICTCGLDDALKRANGE